MQELERCMTMLGLRGVQIGSHINNMPLSGLVRKLTSRAVLLVFISRVCMHPSIIVCYVAACSVGAL